MLHIFKRVGSIVKKILIVMVVYFFVIGLFMYFMKKDTPKVPMYDPIQRQRTQIFNTINDPRLQKSELGRLSVKIYKISACKLLGEACTNNPEDGNNSKYTQNSLVGYMTNMFLYPYANPPASGVYWTYSKLQDSGFIAKSYAAEGIGFAGIKPLIGLWSGFRNIAYMLLVLVLIAIGFMIMFRMKLNPQTVISIENALPKIVLSMILITFSFAIAGFLIDLMYVLLAISIGIISNNGQYYNAGQFQKEYLTANMGMLFSKFFVKGSWGVDFLLYTGNAILWLLGPIISNALRGIVGLLFTVLMNNYTHWIVAKDVANAATDVGAQAATFGAELGKIINLFTGPTSKTIIAVVLLLIGITVITPLIIGLLILMTICMMFFRLFFLLLKAYIQTMIYIIFAPLFLLMEAVPGSKVGFQSWFINLFAEIMTFPIVAIIFCVGYVISNTFVSPSSTSSAINPLSSNPLWSPPFLTGIDPGAFGFLVGITLLFLIPDLIKSFKEMIGAKGMSLNFGVGTLFGGAGAAVGGGVGLASQFGSISLAVPGIRRVLTGGAGKKGLLSKWLDPNFTDADSQTKKSPTSSTPSDFTI